MQDFNYPPEFIQLQPLITRWDQSGGGFIGASGPPSISLLFWALLGCCHPDDDREPSVQ